MVKPSMDEMLAGLHHERSGLRAAGLVGSAHMDGWERALAVDGYVARAALDFLACVEAVLLAFSGGSHFLAVENYVAGHTSRERHVMRKRSQNQPEKQPVSETDMVRDTGFEPVTPTVSR